MAAKVPEGQRPLLQLTYVSRATRPLDPDELEAIHRSARRRNARAGLTGLLLHRDGRFFAALEGPERALLRRMEVIAADPRHRELRILSERRIEARRFRNWSFAALPASGPGPAPGRAEDAFIAMLAGALPRSMN